MNKQKHKSRGKSTRLTSESHAAGLQEMLNLAIQHHQAGRLSEAERAYRRILEASPDNVDALHMLGMLAYQSGNNDSAIALINKALHHSPASAEIHNNLGKVHESRGKPDEAIAASRRAIAINPDYDLAHYNLGNALNAQGKYEEAAASYQHALRIRPDYAEAYHGQATALDALGRQDEAVTCCQEALRIKPEFVDAHITLAAALISLQRPEEALKHCQRAVEIKPDDIDAIALLTDITDQTGDIERAYQHLRPLLETINNDIGADHVNVALAFSSISKHLGRQQEAISLMEQMLERNPSLSVTSRRKLHFNLGKLYDATGEYDKAFAHFQQGNASKPVTSNSARHAAEVDSLIAVYSTDFMTRMPRASIRSDRPVFIVGMARSGTSLVEQILSSHPAVFGAGELPDIIQLPLSLHIILGTEQRYPQCSPLLTQDKLDTLAQHYLERLESLSSDATRVTDKMPGNFTHLGLIELLLPDARVIHCMRDPLDTCLSCYFQIFSRSHPYSYDLANLGAFYNGYRKIMQHWRQVLTIPMMEVQYEELVTNQEPVSRKLIEFCGLEWDERCLEFHKTKRFVGTASFDQVRQPIYKKSVGRWKNYERHIGLLKKVLEL